MPTLAEFAEQFLADRSGKLKPSTLANYRGLLNTHLAPRDERGKPKPGCLGLLRLDQVTHQHVVGLHKSRKATPRAANHTLDFLSSMYSEAATQGFVEENFSPGRRVSRYRIQPRQRFLSEAEFERLGKVLLLAEAAKTEDPYAIAALRLLIFTGCRRDEILTARWDWLDLDRDLLNLPDSKTGAKSIYLSAPALEVLRSLPRVAGNPYIIAGKRAGQRWVNLRKVWVRIRQKAQLAAMPDQHGKPQQVRLHDLRHSYASLLASGGASLPIIGALLGHANPATTARYAHLAADPLRRLSEVAGRQALLALRKSAA
jgi:integrase